MRYPVRNLSQTPIPTGNPDEFWAQFDKVISDTQNLIDSTQKDLAQTQSDIAQKNTELDNLEAVGASSDRLRQAGGELNDLLTKVDRLKLQITRLTANRNYYINYRKIHLEQGQPEKQNLPPTPAPKPAPVPTPAGKAAPPPIQTVAQAPPRVAPSPAPAPVATGARQGPCPEGQFPGNGGVCRGSIGPVPGQAVETPSGGGGAQTLPGLTEPEMTGRRRYPVVNL